MYQTVRSLFLIALLAGLTACVSSTPLPKADYRIRVVTSADGSAVAVPPDCPAWNGEEVSDFENQPFLQFGCATARNLAVMVENPKDLVEGRSPDDGDGSVGAAAVGRYREGKTKALLDPQAASGSGS